MTIIFESYIIPESLLDKLQSNSKVTLDFAAHNLCKAIYSGIRDNETRVRLVNVPNIGSFPSYYKSMFVPGARLEDGSSLPFCNLVYLKRNDIRRRLLKAIDQEIKRIPEAEEVTLLLYNYRCLPFLKRLKQKYHRLKIIMVVTDLPWNTNMAPSILTRVGQFFVGSNNDLKQEYLQYVDGYVLLAPGMKDAIRIGEKPWMHMEGIYESESVVKDIKREQNKVVLYTGNLSRKYGIINLLDAFDKIKDDSYQLWLRGGGDTTDEIQKRSLNDKRIKLLPPLSREELLKLQKSATVLINPVSPSESFTRHFFPSKTLEYLASETPVLMYHLSSMPKEYDDYLFYFEDDSVDGIKNKIVEVCSMDSNLLRQRGKAAASFILENKTPKPQAKRIIDFINSVK